MRHRADRWIDWVDQDSDKVVFSVQLPEGGLSVADVDRFREHLLKLMESPS